jgi:hypothetical protein
MSDRNGRLLILLGTQFATVGLVASMLAAAPEAAWPQAAPPTLGLQSPAQQPAPAAPAPQQIEPPPPREENPGLINEIGKLFEKSKSLLPPLKSPSETIDDLNARTKDAGQSLSNMAKPSTMVSGRAACLVSANGGAGLQGGRRQALPKQRLQGRQEPRHRCSRKMLAESVPAGPQAPAGRLQDGKLRDEGAVPVADLCTGEGHAQTHRRQRQNAILDAGKIALLVGMTSGISRA